MRQINGNGQAVHRPQQPFTLGRKSLFRKGAAGKTVFMIPDDTERTETFIVKIIHGVIINAEGGAVFKSQHKTDIFRFQTAETLAVFQRDPKVVIFFRLHGAVKRVHTLQLFHGFLRIRFFIDKDRHELHIHITLHRLDIDMTAVSLAQREEGIAVPVGTQRKRA